MLTHYGLPALRWLEVTVGDFHAYLLDWIDLLEGSESVTGIGHWGQDRRAARLETSDRSVPDPCPV